MSESDWFVCVCECVRACFPGEEREEGMGMGLRESCSLVLNAFSRFVCVCVCAFPLTNVCASMCAICVIHCAVVRVRACARD